MITVGAREDSLQNYERRMSGSLLKLIIFISLLFDLAVSQDPPDACTTYTPFPDSDRRGINYTLSNGESSIDDNELTEGWYGDRRYTLVEESPGFYKCGGWYPIYIQGRTPIAGQTPNSDLTMCVQSTTEACKSTFSVEARQCDGFEVYLLPQAPVHRAVYCLVANHGGSPQFDEKPRITFELMDKEYSSELLFRCNFTRSSEDLFYKTIWYVEGAPIYTFEPLEWNSDDFDYIANRTLTEQLLKDNGVEKAGFNLQCGVQALYAPGGATSSGELSEVQFVGVKIKWYNTQPLSEGETRRIFLELTVPFGCGTFKEGLNIQCPFDINVVRVQDPDNTSLAAVVENSCSIAKISSKQWHQGTSVTVVGKITPTYGEETATTQLKLKTPNISYELSSFWQDYEIGIVTIQLVKNTTLFQRRYCHSHNDPQIITFNRMWFYLDHAEVYTLYSDLNKIEVQIQTEDCGRERRRYGPFCTCGVAVRAGRTVFEISHCKSLTWHIGYTACGDDGDVLQVRRIHLKHYMIHLPTGNTVNVNLENDPYFLNVYVTSSVNDVGKSRGMCGELSATSDDDLIMRGGSVTNSTEDFAESWRVNKTDNFFDPEVISAGLSSYKPLLQYCTCEEKGLTCTAMAASDTVKTPRDIQKIKPKNCVISKRKKRMALRTQKRSKRQVQPSGRWFNGWNETLAQAYCEDKFSESKAVKVCGDVPGVNVANSKRECVKDIQLSGTDAFATMAVESVYAKCFREALVNPILNMSEPGKPSVFEKITEETCTQDCSKRGVCKEGQCHCNPGFGGGDCSVELSNPPTLFDVGDGGRCDLATGKCIETAVLGDIFSGEESSRCQIKKSMVKQDGQMAISSVTTSKAVTESISEVTCYLPDALADDVTTSYNISVSNIGTFYSNELTVLVYDSTCVTVNNDTMIWSLRDGYCTHKGKCVMEGDTLEEDACVSCEINDNQRIWKTATGGICGNRAGNVSDERLFVMLGLLVAAAAALNHGQ
ncbi:uncharacterized protein LOC124131984 isoform X2 [Haliotis rufescens]|uniref:uncharacterized protein LOC124131984 isoform X2 n=1 Tax=Haliotis rufescens TaxID=6454 RepID=UPI00201F84DC|nr:uncharacterized protein LOC124131984 isoform X2 [Haliotis rufescens]